MNIKTSPDKKGYDFGKIGQFIKNPDNSIFTILIAPFLFSLVWVFLEMDFDSEHLHHLVSFLDGYLLPFIASGPVFLLIFYAYFSENRNSSAIFGFLLLPLIFFYAHIIDLAFGLQFKTLIRYLDIRYISNLFLSSLPFSIIHSLIGYLVASRKRSYLAAASLLTVIYLIIFYFVID